jgi:hypothetical protein|tara:strand:+ start:30069 stop:30332 length:264 start_codon:yes stop_codon:yes gene_type:complete
MEIFIGERLISDYYVQKSVENIIHNALYRGTFELYKNGENLFINIQNSNYISKETHEDLGKQIKIALKDCECKSLIYTYGKKTAIIN